METEQVQATCRWCGKTLMLDQPKSELGRKYMRQLLKAAACNRCADYHRKQFKRYEMIDVLLRPMVGRTRRPGDDKDEKIQKLYNSVRAIFVNVVKSAEEFYGENLMHDMEANLKFILENPHGARNLCADFDKGLRITAKLPL